jgi:hypothetical protein
LAAQPQSLNLPSASMFVNCIRRGTRPGSKSPSAAGDDGRQADRHGIDLRRPRVIRGASRPQFGIDRCSPSLAAPSPRRERPSTVEAFDEAVLAIVLPIGSPSLLSGTGGDDILSILNDSGLDVPTVPMPLVHALPCPELPVQFDPGGTTSDWWTNPGNGGPLRGFASDAGLSPSLLLTTMRHPGGAGASR